jgi:hypothetical protein
VRRDGDESTDRGRNENANLPKADCRLLYLCRYDATLIASSPPAEVVMCRIEAASGRALKLVYSRSRADAVYEFGRDLI